MPMVLSRVMVGSSDDRRKLKSTGRENEKDFVG